MTIDAYATQPNYLAHLAPIWQGLRQHMGRFYTAGLLANEPGRQGIMGRAIGHPPRNGGLVMVAGYMDEAVITRPMIYVEHGAGQTYAGDSTAALHEAYSGSPGHDRVKLFICPSETVAHRWRMRYPRAQAVAVGCPKLDVLHKMVAAHPWEPPGTDRPPCVAFTFHSNNRLCPESVTAFPHYEADLPNVIAALRQAGFRVLGHGHPRLWRTLGPYWEALGVEPAIDLEQVFQQADILVGDNTSALPEFASLGRPIVFMNAPWYRSEVFHGGRFWDWTDGQIVVDDPHEITGAVVRALANEPDVAAARQRMVDDVYVACDGLASQRAVDAIIKVMPPAPTSPLPRGAVNV